MEDALPGASPSLSVLSGSCGYAASLYDALIDSVASMYNPCALCATFLYFCCCCRYACYLLFICYIIYCMVYCLYIFGTLIYCVSISTLSYLLVSLILIYVRVICQCTLFAIDPCDIYFYILRSTPTSL